MYTCFSHKIIDTEGSDVVTLLELELKTIKYVLITVTFISHFFPHSYNSAALTGYSPSLYCTKRTVLNRMSQTTVFTLIATQETLQGSMV
jgi:hypothetical protein